jgi:hypothetical protein
MTLAELVAAAKNEVPDCSALRIWGADIFRPGDLVYAVKSVAARGDTLRVELFLALDNSTDVVEVDAPEGGRIMKASLKISRAAAVRWNGERRSRPPGSMDPALHLGN